MWIIAIWSLGLKTQSKDVLKWRAATRSQTVEPAMLGDAWGSRRILVVGLDVSTVNTRMREVHRHLTLQNVNRENLQNYITMASNQILERAAQTWVGWAGHADEAANCDAFWWWPHGFSMWSRIRLVWTLRHVNPSNKPNRLCSNFFFSALLDGRRAN